MASGIKQKNMELNGKNLDNSNADAEDRLVGQQDHDDGDTEDNLTDVMEQVDSASGTRKKEYGFNSRSNMIHKLINVGLLAANFGQLKVIISFKENKYYHLNLVLVVLSIVAQISFVACMLVIWHYEYKVAKVMKQGDKILKAGDSRSENSKAGGSTAGDSKAEDLLEAKLKTGMSRLVFWNNFGFALMAVIIVLNLCLSVFFEGDDSDSSAENIGQTKYIGVVNGTLQVIE